MNNFIVGDVVTIPNGYFPNGKSRPHLKCRLVSLPAAGSNNNICQVRTLAGHNGGIPSQFINVPLCSIVNFFNPHA